MTMKTCKGNINYDILKMLIMIFYPNIEFKKKKN